MSTNTSVSTEVFENAIKTTNSVISKYDECIRRADEEFRLLNEVWNDPQYVTAKAEFDTAKKGVMQVIEALKIMKSDMEHNAQSTEEAAARIKGIWG